MRAQAWHSTACAPCRCAMLASAAAEPARRSTRGLPVHIHVAEQVLEVKACLARDRTAPHRTAARHRIARLRIGAWCMPRMRRPRNSRALQPAPRPCAYPSAPRPISATDSSTRPGFSRRADVCAWGPTVSQPSVRPRNYAGSNTSSVCARSAAACWRHGAEAHVGTRLWRDAAQHGAHAIGQPAGAIEVGRRADWLVLDDAPSVHGGRVPRAPPWIICCSRAADAAIRDVMVAGRWVIKGPAPCRRGRIAAAASPA